MANCTMYTRATPKTVLGNSSPLEGQKAIHYPVQSSTMSSETMLADGIESPRPWCQSAIASSIRPSVLLTSTMTAASLREIFGSLSLRSQPQYMRHLPESTLHNSWQRNADTRNQDYSITRSFLNGPYPRSMCCIRSPCRLRWIVGLNGKNILFKVAANFNFYQPRNCDPVSRGTSSLPALGMAPGKLASAWRVLHESLGLELPSTGLPTGFSMIVYGGRLLTRT
jgi:hypothetical protein